VGGDGGVDGDSGDCGVDVLDGGDVVVPGDDLVEVGAFVDDTGDCCDCVVRSVVCLVLVLAAALVSVG
jgi:hypothetical protein